MKIQEIIACEDPLFNSFADKDKRQVIPDASIAMAQKRKNAMLQTASREISAGYPIQVIS